MAASSHKLAAAITTRLAAVVPAPISVRAEGDLVSVYSGEQWAGSSAAAAIVEDDDDRTPNEKLEAAFSAILSGVQDYVARELGDPWPKTAKGDMAMPNTRIGGGHVLLWFGEDERTPVITLTPISITELEELG